MANWKRNGNGKGNYNHKDVGVGEKIIRFNGATYAEDLEEFENDDDDKELKLVDDNCFSFCYSRISTLFFWCMLDLIGMVTFIKSNSEECGVSSHSREVDETSGRSAVSGSCSKGRNTLMHSMMTQQRDMMSKFQGQMEKPDVANHVLLLRDQVWLARVECSRM